MRIEEIVKNDNVQAFLRNYKKVLETRSLTGVELTIPDEFLGIIRENIENYSKLYKYVTVRTVKGHGRLAVTGAIPEAVWTDACAVLNELDISMTGVDVAAWKVGGYVTVCNATIEDSDVDLTKEILEVLGDAIGYALDKVIVYGNGYREPLGAATRLNVTTVTGSGAQLLKDLVVAAGSARSQYSTGKKVWLMNANTLDALRAQAIYAAGTGIIGGILDSVETLDFILDGEIVVGYFDLYLLADRGEIKFATSKDAEFTKDRTLLKAAGRYDGTPIIKTAFARIYVDITDVPTPGGSPEPITITENGTYQRADGYSPVTVNVKQDNVRTTYYNGDVTVTGGTASITFKKIMGDDSAEVAGVLKLDGKEYAFWRKKLNGGKNTFRGDTAITMTPVFVDEGDDFVGLNLTDLPLADGTYTALVTDTPDQPASAATYKTNGTHTVLDEGLVIVDVPQPSGKITITENGTDINVADYATADVNVQSAGGDTLGQLLDGTLTEYTSDIAAIKTGYVFGSSAAAHAGITLNFPQLTEISKADDLFMNFAGIINIPKVESIEGTACFNGSKIKVLPETLQFISGNECFAKCTDLGPVVDMPNVKQFIGNSIFSGCTGITKLNVPKCYELGEYMCSGLKGLTTVDFGSVSSRCIGRSAFQETGLQTVTLAGSTAKLYSRCFSYCRSLTTVDMTDVTEIGSDVFNGCSALEKVIIRHNERNMYAGLKNVNAFANTPIASGTGYIYVTDALVDTYKAATNWATYADQIRPLSEYTESE